ncbi:hypothetical protein JHK82_055351 [Glycine max]|nr:hypothetical protein JHK82_055351 [Glycine max]
MVPTLAAFVCVENQEFNVHIKKENGQMVMVPLYQSQENIVGEVIIEPSNGKKVKHNGVKIELLGRIDTEQSTLNAIMKVYSTVFSCILIEATAMTLLLLFSTPCNLCAIRELDVPGNLHERKTSDTAVAARGWLQGPVPPREKEQGRRTKKRQERIFSLTELVRNVPSTADKRYPANPNCQLSTFILRNNL